MARVPSKRCGTSQGDAPATQDSSWLDLLTSSLGIEDMSGVSYSGPPCPDIGSPPSDEQQVLCESPLSSTTKVTVAEVGHKIDEWVHSSNQSESLVSFNENPLETENQLQHNRKCFGKIHCVSMRLERDLSSLRTTIMEFSSSAVAIPLRLTPLCNVILVSFKNGTKFGQLCDRLTEPLRSARRIQSVSFEAFVDFDKCLQAVNKPIRPGEDIVEIDINVYGNAEARDALGSCFSTHGIYLQHPTYCEETFEYDNPHMMDFDLDSESEDDPSIPADVPREPEDRDSVDTMVKKVCHQESRDRGLQGLDGGALVHTSLFQWQKEAVEFMLQREIGPITDEFRLWRRDDSDSHTEYRHILTGECSPEYHPETGGGILADDMGMGKTLSALSLIARSLPDALEWSNRWQGTEGTSGVDTPAKATLIVLPSLLIMNEWLEQITVHLDSSVQVLKYHGKRRETVAAKTRDSDIVLTTYHTLAADRKLGRAHLRRIAWFRILLDEAHTIRQQQTTLFAAVSELSGSRRWCLTGTPIHNSLNDLGSLLAFIRADPFDRPLIFRKHVSMPFYEDVQDGVEKLSLLLNSFCLRRSSRHLQLRPLDLVEHTVVLTAEERQQYTETLALMAFANSHGSREKRLKLSRIPYGGFQIQLQLRLICNHGTFQRPFSWDEIDLQSQREDVIHAMGAKGEISCSRCYERTPVLATNCTARKYLQVQSPVLCNECEGLDNDQPNMLSRPRMLGMVPSVSTAMSAGNRVDATFNSSGFSSKMELLLSFVNQNLAGTKSIIFSCWTKTLDLVELHLERKGLGFVRIDGDTSQAQRQPILNRFSREDDIRILLMTTGTGAYGLNITVANRIFIVEPYWNPSVELQAIARAQRYPQSKTVQVHRFIVAGTVEKDIRHQQNTKVEVASAGFQGNKNVQDPSEAPIP